MATFNVITQLKAADHQLTLYNTMAKWQEHKKQRIILSMFFRESADSHTPCVAMDHKIQTQLQTFVDGVESILFRKFS